MDEFIAKAMHVPHFSDKRRFGRKRSDIRCKTSPFGAIISVRWSNLLDRVLRREQSQIGKNGKKGTGKSCGCLKRGQPASVASGLPRVVVIENGLYRVSASGAKELIRTLTPRTKATGRGTKAQGVTRGAPTPRVRMFAGPNGSGKTTVQREIARPFPSDFLGVLVNPDDIEATIARYGRLDLGQFSVSAAER